MTSNKSIALLLACILIGLVFFTVQTIKINNLRADLEIRKIDLKKKDKQLRMHIDSSRLVVKQLAQRDSFWSGVVKDQLNLLIAEREKTRIISIRYAKLKNTPAPAWSNKQLDSLLFTIIGH